MVLARAQVRVWASPETLFEQAVSRGPHVVSVGHLATLRDQAGREEDAILLYARALELLPTDPDTHSNIARILARTGRTEQALWHYRRALQLKPAFPGALNNLGLLHGRTGRPDDAERLLRRAVELAPDNADFRQNLANQYLRMGRIADALQQCHDGLVRAPRSRLLRGLLVLAYCMLDRQAEAEQVLNAWIAADPDDPYPRHHLAACTGQGVPERADDAYVAGLFDGFAGSFDAKLADLSYQAPQHVTGALARLSGAAGPVLDVLDAGCGTGLCGPLLAPVARTLTGVDLSEGMLRIAHPRGCYDDLFLGELVAFLGSRPGSFDAVVSADTLCYFGVLGPFAAAAHAALRPGGWLVFTVEALDDTDPLATAPGHRLHPHGRYSHGRAHVLAVLQAAGLGSGQAEPVFLRNEGGTAVQGWLVSAQRPASPL